MASLVEMTKELSSLQDMFQDLDIAVVHKVFKDYEGHPNKFDAAVTELLTIHAVKEQAIQDADQADEPLADASSDAPGPAAFEQVVQVFPDLSRSVIGGALFQNQGQVAGAIELLINIGQDKDAIAQIRDMNPEKKAEYANDRARERELELRAREQKLEAERAEAERAAQSERDAARAERVRQEEAAKVKYEAKEDFVRMLEAKMAVDLANQKAQDNARAFSEAERLAEAERKAGGSEHADRLVHMREQKERDAALAREAQDQLLGRLKAQQERLGLPELDLERSIAHLKGEAERRIMEQRRYEEDAAAGVIRLAELEARTRQQADQLEGLRREREMQRQCSLSAEYSQKDKRLLVSWVLGEDRKPTSSDWVGVFSISSTNPKQYHTYISTESLSASSHECPLPTEPGFYICLFFHGKALEPIASSDQIYLGASLEMVANADPIRRVITMQYEVKTGNPTNKDWIGFYRTDKTNNRQYIEYKWLQPDRLSGVWEVKMPRRGGYDYEFRFFSHTSSKPMQTSNKVKLAKEDYLSVKSSDVLETQTMVRDEVSWTIVSVDPTNWDWIELVTVPDHKRVTWNYIDANALHSTYNRPRTPGSYRYRYWARSIGSGPVALSPIFEVANRDKLMVSDVDGVLQVTHSVVSIDNNTSCWIGLYPENSDKYLSFQYIAAPTDNNKTLKFTKPSAGNYEARFFHSSDKKSPVIKSAVFTVE